MFYTTNPGYKELNKALRGEIPKTAYFKEYEQALNQAIGKLPNYNLSNSDYLLRIEDLTQTQIASEYVIGADITKKAFTSTTYSPYALVQASRKKPHTIILKIKARNGKLIEPTSTLQSEREVLLKSNTRFRVDDIKIEQHPDLGYHRDDFIKVIFLTEL